MAGLAASFGSGAMSNSMDDVAAHAKAFFIIGSNTTEQHPVFGTMLRRAVKFRGAKLVVADPRCIDITEFATLHLRHKPGSDIALVNGLMYIILEKGWEDKAFIEERCENFENFLDSLKSFHPGFVEQITGVPAEQLALASRMYATSKPATILYTMGITQHTHGTDNVMATANLAMLTGNVGKPSTGVNPLRGQNNVQGACDMGSLPTVYSGYQSVADPNVQKKFQEAWGYPLSLTPGRTLTEIIEAAYLQPIKAIYLVGENPGLSDPDATHVRKALEKLEFLVVQDIFLTETAQLADVVLPAACFAEKDGTFTNTERRVQRVRKFIEPPGDSRPDWQITSQLARRMGGKGFDYQEPEQIMAEISRLTPSYGGITYQRIEKGGLQWPCPTAEHPGTLFLHKDTFTRGKGKFVPLQYRPSAELPDADYPLILTTERSPYHFHTSTMTRKVKGLEKLRSEELVEINPTDARKLGVADGQMVKVTSRRGQVEARARVTTVSPPGVVSMTFHFAESPTNVLTNPALDPVAKIPELNVAAVRVAPCESPITAKEA